MPSTPQEWMEFHKQCRVKEGVSLAEQQMIQALAQVVVVDKLERAVIIGATKSGRTITMLTGEPTAAEQKWAEMQAARR